MSLSLFFSVKLNQLMVHCWLGWVVWIPGNPLWKGLLLSYLMIPPIRIPDHWAPNHQLAIIVDITPPLDSPNKAGYSYPPHPDTSTPKFGNGKHKSEAMPRRLEAGRCGNLERPGRSGSRYVLRKGFPLYSYCGDGIETINPTLGRGMDP